MKTQKKNETKTQAKKWKELNRLTEKEHQGMYDSYYDNSYYDLIAGYKNEYNEKENY